MQFGNSRARMRVLLIALIGFTSTQLAAHLPDDFVLETYVADLQRPVDIEWAPNGLLFVAEKSGTVAVIENGVLQPESFINIREQVNRAIDRGLLGLAIHPDFPSTPYVYLLHVYDPPETAGLTGNDKPDGQGQRVARLIRVTADAATGYKSAIPGSEVVILGKNSTWENIGDPTADQLDIDAPFACGPEGAFVDDCIPADGLSHSIGMVTFGADGMLYVGNGDASTWTTVNPGSVRALRVDSLAGKIMRIDPETGLGLPDNPYWDGNADSNRSRVWHLGLRNPFRFRQHPATDEWWIADVGWEDWEELNRAPAGADFGWPCYEGGNGGLLQQAGYSSLTACQEYYASDAAVAPAYSYPHRSGFGGSIIVGEFYQANKWPAEYQGSLMISDFAFQELSIAKFIGDTVVVTPFGDDVLSVDLAVGPDGDIYSANVATGDIERIRYVGDGSSGGGEGTVIARFGADFAGPAPVPGWSYTWNANGPVGDRSAEQDLLYTGNFRYDSDGVAGLPDATAMNFGFIGPSTMHPGKGQEQGEADDRYAIARWAVSQDGFYELNNGQILQNGCEFTNGVDLLIMVDEQIVHQHVIEGGIPDSINEDLDYLETGSSIAVAVGPNGKDGCDQVQIDWDVVYTSGTPPVGEAPVVTISSPPGDQLWRVDDMVSFTGSAMDAEDGDLSGDALLWEGNIIHNTHSHPGFYLENGATGSLIYPDHGDNSYIELCLVATDSDGRKGKDCIDLRPEVSTYSFETVPAGLEITYNGESDLAPYSVDIQVGGERLVSAPWMQGDFVFSGWSNGGQASQQIIVGDLDTSLVATYLELEGPIEETVTATSSSGDDAEETQGGAVILDSANLDMTLDADNQVIGLRFSGVNIEPGALITDAYIQFTADEASSDPTSLVIQVQASDSADEFMAQAGDISSRSLGNAEIAWSPTAWLSAGDAAISQRTPNLAEIMAEVIARPNWTSGNAMAFVISGEGRRVARAFDSPQGGAPMLVVTFANPDSGPTTPPPPTPPSGGGGGGGSAVGGLFLVALLIPAFMRRRLKLGL